MFSFSKKTSTSWFRSSCSVESESIVFLANLDIDLVCMVSSYYLSSGLSDVDFAMCELKRHLFRLSLLFNHMIKKTDYYKVIFFSCVEKSKRFDEDSSVTEYLSQHSNVSFMDIKMNRDNYI